jgi:mono/diheme cytochrome c family protein
MNSTIKALRIYPRRVLTLIPLLLGVLLIVSLSASAGNVAAQEPLEPPVQPDAENGLPIFAERCANCHGPAGEGDGELAANLPLPPRNFADPVYLRGALPATMFQTITEGILDGGMPPFGPASSNPVGTSDRWDLVAAVYSLGTEPAAITRGTAVYEENCLACHGESGMGDGPDAAGAATPPTDLTDLRYWSNRSNEMVFAALQDEAISDHTYDLNEDALRDVVDYGRTFSYFYADPQAAFAPIEAATISGLVMNGSTGEALATGTVLLRAFTADLQEAATMTTEVGEDGRFSFDLTDVSPDWVYLASTDFGDLSFSSNPDRLERRTPELDMPITVYETTSDPAAVNIDQVHMLLDFADDRLLVTEIYVLSNREPAVFVGASGNPDEGTFEIRLPEGAENVEFQRSFRSFESFLPATEVMPTDAGYADTVPIRPGDGAMNLLVTYDMAFEDGMVFEHPLAYAAANATAVLPEAGVELQGDGWESQGAQQMGNAGTVLSYARPGLAAGESLNFVLNGRPSVPAAARVGGSGAGGGINETAALLLGGTIFLAVLGGGAYMLNSWRGEEADEPEADVNELLYAVLALDDAHDAGKLDDETYQQRRAALMEDLVAVWPQPAAQR